MSQRPMNLEAIRRELTGLDADLTAYPELTQPAARERLTAWLGQETAMLEEKTVTIYARIPPSLLGVLDAYLAGMAEESPGRHTTRSDAIRELLYQALRAVDVLPRLKSLNSATSDRAEDLGPVLLELVQALFPLDTPVYPRTLYGLTTFPLYAINTVLERYGYVLHATHTRVAQRVVACLDTHGREEPYGLFELRRITAED